MNKNRVEAFSDGFFAIIITVMVLGLRIPTGTTLLDLLPISSTLFCYVLSFVYLAIYWNNHHHLFQAVKEVNGKILWANIHLLFWISFVPFVTTWAGESYFAKIPTALYGFILLMAACAYSILIKALISKQGRKSILAVAMGRDLKGKISILLYLIAIIISFWLPKWSFAIYVLVALIWFIPDPRIEEKL